MIGAVRIHDGEALGAAVLGAGFGDIGDPAVEEGALAGQARIDQVGAFVRGAAPVARRNDEALPGELGLQSDVVKIAADGELAVRIGLDEALDQSLGAASAPIAYSGARTWS